VDLELTLTVLVVAARLGVAGLCSALDVLAGRITAVASATTNSGR
jgi:hypothetical protein